MFLAELKQVFKICDKSGKGYITPVELKAVMKSVGDEMDNDDMKVIFDEIDEDGKPIQEFSCYNEWQLINIFSYFYWADRDLPLLN